MADFEGAACALATVDQNRTRAEELSQIPEPRPAFEPQELAAMEFPKAAKVYIDANRHRWRKKSLIGFESHARAMPRFFGAARLDTIHIGHILEYQNQRITNSGSIWPNPVGPGLVNHELSFLRRLLKAANLWRRNDEAYRPLRLPQSKKPRVMTDIEKQRFFAVASSKPEWQLCLCVAIITNNTSCSGVELRNLQLQDVVIDGEFPRMTVNAKTAKNYYRARTVTLNQAAVDAMRICLERAYSLGSCEPEHYIFSYQTPRCAFIPSKPTTDSWLQRKWPKLREAAGLPWLTPHCLRHQCITELCEADVPREVIKQIAGHVTDQNLFHYSHARDAQQAEALEKLMHGHVRVILPGNEIVSTTCPYCGVACTPGLAFCANGDVLDEAKARKARPWLFRQEASSFPA